MPDSGPSTSPAAPYAQIFDRAFQAYGAAAAQAATTGSPPDFSEMKPYFAEEDHLLVVTGDHALAGEFRGFDEFTRWLMQSGQPAGFQVVGALPHRHLDANGNLVVTLEVRMNAGGSEDTLTFAFRGDKIISTRHQIGNEQLAREVYGPAKA